MCRVAGVLAVPAAQQASFQGVDGGELGVAHAGDVVAQGGLQVGVAELALAGPRRAG